MNHIMRILILILLAALASPGHAQQINRQQIEKQFHLWLKEEIWPRAQRRGVSAPVFNAAFANVNLDWQLPDLVPPGSQPQTSDRQHQSEFRSPARYFSPNALGGVIAGGKTHLARHRDLLEEIEHRTGVPGRIVIAIWGRESGFGRADIPHNAIEVLATKAFMSTRKEMFEGELLAALDMVQRYGLSPGRLKSSWAGALGQPQFMPTSYLEHAVDGDGDGEADIWNSEADSLASIANYLASKGWTARRDWGFEVIVPDSVPCFLEGPDRGRTIAEWAQMGVVRVNGRPFPAHERSREGYLLMPAGRFGPAFIVTPNFYVLKEYNESDVYALFVGHAGDRMQFGIGPFVAEWAKTDEMPRSEVAAIQTALVAQGHDVGGVDGLAGYKTRRSIGQWQADRNMEPKCFPQSGLAGRIK
jgi:lytic murein transglycosylase